MRLFVWLARSLLFFTLFAFALNNQQTVTLHWFFGYAWTAPLVWVVLAAFIAGAGVGVAALLPSWWRLRSQRKRAEPLPTAASPSLSPPQPDWAEPRAEAPPRDVI
jgi:putative membrane protein